MSGSCKGFKKHLVKTHRCISPKKYNSEYLTSIMLHWFYDHGHSAFGDTIFMSSVLDSDEIPYLKSAH